MATLRMRLLFGTLLAGAAPMFTPLAAAHAQSATPKINGAIELLTRAYAERPQPEDRAKFEQYGEMPPGLFVSRLDLSATLNPHATTEFSASNIGLNNQAYRLRASDSGRMYLNLEFFQTPHLFSTQAMTLFERVGPDSLRIADSTRSALAAAVTNAARAAIIDGNVRPVALDVQRSKTQANLRWTPAPSWDVRLDYTYEQREGSMPLGAPLNGFNSIEMPAPVSTLTQNFGVSVQYAGKFSDTRRWTAALAYNGSLFADNLSSITFDNPFRLAAPNGNNASANEGRVSTPPSNEAHRVTFTGSADLPFNARYVGTASVARMIQNDLFIPFTINTSIPGADSVNGLPAATPLSALDVLPGRSLQGKIKEVMVNNQLTMRLDPKLTLTARARYLDLNNRSLQFFFPSYVLADGQRQNDDRRNTQPSYQRSNASIDLHWRPALGWQFGAAGGWENYDRDNRDVDVTNEYSGKLFVDAKPRGAPWLRARASVSQAARRYETYDNAGNVGAVAIPNGAGIVPNPLMRKFDMANRDRTQVDGSLDFTLSNGIAFSPSARWRNIDYSDNDANSGDLGVKDEDYWNAGGALSWPISSRVRTNFSYLHERYDRAMVNRQRGVPGPAGACAGTPAGSDICNWGSGIADDVDTVEANGTFILRPNVLTLNIGAVYAETRSATSTYAPGSAQVTSTPQFPEVKNTFERVDAKLDYVLNRAMTLQLAYALERNAMTNWQIDSLQPYMVAIDAGAVRSLFLDAFNPNYTASIAAVRLAMKW